MYTAGLEPHVDRFTSEGDIKIGADVIVVYMFTIMINYLLFPINFLNFSLNVEK